MLNSTKTWQEEQQQFINQSAKDINKELGRTWQEEFDEEFPNERGIFENNDPYNSRRKAIKHFITDLRKRDMEALIGMFNRPPVLTRLTRERLIKDYYEK